MGVRLLHCSNAWIYCSLEVNGSHRLGLNHGSALRPSGELKHWTVFDEDSRPVGQCSIMMMMTIIMIKGEWQAQLEFPRELCPPAHETRMIATAVATSRAKWRCSISTYEYNHFYIWGYSADDSGEREDERFQQSVGFARIIIGLRSAL